MKHNVKYIKMVNSNLKNTKTYGNSTAKGYRYFFMALDCRTKQIYVIDQQG